MLLRKLLKTAIALGIFTPLIITNSFAAGNIQVNNNVVGEERSIKIAVIDFQTVLENSLAASEVRKSIEKISQSIRNELSKKEAELKKIEGDLIEKRGILDEATFKKQVDEFNQKVTIAQQDAQNKKIKLEQAHLNAMSKINAMIMNIIQELVKKYNLDLVIPSSQILYAKDELNITEEVLQLLNQRLKNTKLDF